jgi:gamma-glutamylcyclotransferase (GGCT)/AIG2-like uncharacterized protein YtfP
MRMDASLLYTHQTQSYSQRPTPTVPTAMGDHTAFFYGTLMAPKVLHRVCYGPSVPLSTTQHSALNVRPALLKSYRRHRVRGADYPAIMAAQESTVRGALVTGLTDGDIWRLDIFEGEEYQRRKVKVRAITDQGDMNVEPTEAQLGDEVEAETYIWIAGRQLLDDNEWDFEEFVREKMSRWVGSGGEEAGEYNGENIRPSILGSSNGQRNLWDICIQFILTVHAAEVDQAVQAGTGENKDPTGGRFNGSIATALEQSRDNEQAILKSAV